MTFDELEVGKEYIDHADRVVVVLAKARAEMVAEHRSGKYFDGGQPFITYSPINPDLFHWRPYTPPPEPVVRYVYARYYSHWAGSGSYQGNDEEDALRDPQRIGPVIRVELPVDPDMLARVRGGAK